MVDYLTKKIEKVYSFSTITDSHRYGAKTIKVNGRDYSKYGTYQAVTLVGILYNVFDPSIKRYKKILHVGVAKQNPRDLVISKEIAYEVAHNYALIEPQCVMEVGDNWRKVNFTDFARNYISAMDLEFVKTAKELEDEQKPQDLPETTVQSELDDVIPYEIVYDDLEHPNRVIGLIDIDPKTLTRVVDKETNTKYWVQFKGVQGKEIKLLDTQILLVDKSISREAVNNLASFIKLAP